MREKISQLGFWEVASVFPALGRYVAIPLAIVLGVGVGIVLLAKGNVVLGVLALTLLLPATVGLSHLALQAPFVAMGLLTAGVFWATRQLWRLEGASLRDLSGRLRR